MREENKVARYNSLSDLERQILYFVCKGYRVADMEDKVCKTALAMHKMINEIYLKLGIDVKNELLNSGKKARKEYGALIFSSEHDNFGRLVDV